jgi:hypothetical protein
MKVLVHKFLSMYLGFGVEVFQLLVLLEVFVMLNGFQN